MYDVNFPTVFLIQNAWGSHEKNLRKYLEHRENINKEEAEQLYSEGDSFEQFWNNHCSKLSTAAMTCFFCGTITLLVAILIFMWATFSITYKNVTAAALSVGIIIVSIVVSVWAWIIFRKTDLNDFPDNEQSDEEKEGQEAKDQILDADHHQCLRRRDPIDGPEKTPPSFASMV